jgi:hypothetical protein
MGGRSEADFLEHTGKLAGTFSEIALWSWLPCPVDLVPYSACPILLACPDCLSPIASSFRPVALLRLPDRLLL